MTKGDRENGTLFVPFPHESRKKKGAGFLEEPVRLSDRCKTSG